MPREPKHAGGGDGVGIRSKSPEQGQVTQGDGVQDVEVYSTIRETVLFKIPSSRSP